MAAQVSTRSDVDLERLTCDWIASKKGRKPNSVAFEVTVIRQFCLFLRRRDPGGFVPGRVWAPQRAESRYLPYIFTEDEIHSLLSSASLLKGSELRRSAIRTLILLLYCTGLRFGEALRLRMHDVDLDEAVLFVEFSKGRSRFVPFGHDLAYELKQYAKLRGIDAAPDAPFFVRGKRGTTVGQCRNGHHSSAPPHSGAQATNRSARPATLRFAPCLRGPSADEVVHKEMNYFVRSTWVILGTIAAVAIPTLRGEGWGIRAKDLVTLSSKGVGYGGIVLLASLVLCHVVFH